MTENLHGRKEQGKAEVQNKGKAAWNPEQHLERSKNRLLLGVSCFSWCQWEAVEDFKQDELCNRAWTLAELDLLLILVLKAIKHRTKSYPLSGADSLGSLYFSPFIFNLSPEHKPMKSCMWKFTVSCVLVTQWCPTLCSPVDCSLPGSSGHGILQARILEWVASPQNAGYNFKLDLLSLV